ncbi:MAG: hypothetical protein V4472_17530 [Pseudomonadota bacterium]
MDRARIRRHTLRVTPTLAHIQAYERRFTPIDGETFRELSAALTAIYGSQRFQLHTFREAYKEFMLNKLYQDQAMSAIAKALQHSSTKITEQSIAKQKP